MALARLPPLRELAQPLRLPRHALRPQPHRDGHPESALTPLHALELVLDAASDARVRADWAALAAAGLPSQARHAGTTNAPHVTLVAAAAIGAAVEEAAVAAVAALLPARVGLAGLALLGTGPCALARLLTLPVPLETAARDLRARVDGVRPGGWIPHVTLARRLGTDQVGDALTVLAGSGEAAVSELVVGGLRRWDPDTATTRLLTGRDVG